MLCAKYMILETQPKCTIDASPDNTLEGDRVRLTCEVVYNGTNIVSLVWKGVDDAPAAVKSGITISRSFSVAASPHSAASLRLKLKMNTRFWLRTFQVSLVKQGPSKFNVSI